MNKISKNPFLRIRRSNCAIQLRLLRLAFSATILLPSYPVSAGLLDNLLDKAQELAKPLSNLSEATSKPVRVDQPKRAESAFSVDQLLGITEPKNPAAIKQLPTADLGNAAEFDPIVCNSALKKLSTLNNEGSLVFGSKGLKAETIEQRLSECRFFQTKAALGQMASLFYSAMGNPAEPDTIASGNDSAKALGVIASAFADAGNLPKAIEASQVAIKKADNSTEGVSERVYAARTMVRAMVSQGDQGIAEAELARFVAQNRGQLEQRGVVPTLFALGEAYQRLGYPAKAAYIYRHASSTLNNALGSTAGNPFAAIALAMAGMQCMMNDQVVTLSGLHLTNGYMCDAPYHGISLSEVRYAQTTTLLGKADDLVGYYKDIFLPALNTKPPEGWLAPPVLPAKIRAHAVFADALEKVQQNDLALAAWERIAEDIGRFEDFSAAQTLIDNTSSTTHDDFASYLGRFLLLSTELKTEDKQAKALGYWLAFKGSAATQYKIGLNLLSQSGNKKIAQLLADADRERVQVRQQLLQGSAPDADTIRTRMVDVSNKVFNARQEFVQKSSGGLIKDGGLQQSAKTILASIRNSLTDDDVFIDFARTQANDEEPIYLMSVIEKSTGFRTSLINGRNIDIALAELHRNIRASISGGQTPPKETIDRSTRVVYDGLGSLVLNAAKGRSILHISPDGVLGSYPFEISADGTGNYPFSDKIISYVSAPLDFATKPGEKEKSGITVIANPDYQGNIPPAVGANRYVGRGFQFPALPDTEVEAKFIRDIGSKQGFTIMSFAGSSATKSALINQPIAGNILHFATHGFYFSDDPKSEFGEAIVARRFSDRNPLWRSGLALTGANVDRTGGILYAAEILRMNLKNTDIVILSACDTGSGYYSSAEGVIGLTRAFTISGARSVISSKWPVSSAETVTFMEYLYDQNPTGIQAARAMRDARLRMFERFPNPYLWGAFTINQSGN